MKKETKERRNFHYKLGRMEETKKAGKTEERNTEREREKK